MELSETGLFSQLLIGLLALVVLAGTIFVILKIAGPSKKPSGQKAKDQGISEESIRGGEISRPNEAPFSEMEENTLNQEMSQKET